MSQATLHTSMGAIAVELFDDDAPKTVANFKKLAERRLLQRRHLPPRHPRLHDPGRRPDRDRLGRARATRSRTSSTTTGRARRARDGELRAEHERLAVLHRHGRCVPVARRQAHRVRPRDRRDGRRRRDLGGRPRLARQAARGRHDRARRARPRAPSRTGRRSGSAGTERRASRSVSVQPRFS